MVHLIVCGSAPRKSDPPFQYAERLHSVLEALYQSAGKAGFPIQSITTGVAAGVDLSAKQYAFERLIWTNDFPANWAEQNRSAGPIRNRHMVRETIARYGHSNIIAYGFVDKPLEQSRGTSSCLEIAGKEFGLRTHLFRLDENSWEF